MRAWKQIAILLVVTACADDDSAGDASTGTTSQGAGTDGESVESTTGVTATADTESTTETSTTDHETGGSCPDVRACEWPDDCEMGFYCKDGCCEPIPI